MPNKKTCLVVCFTLLCSCFCKAQNNLGFALEDGKTKVVIPFELHNNLVVVPVVLNGVLPLKFVVDTGVQTTILTEKAFIDILNLPYSRKFSISGPGRKQTIEAFVTNNVMLSLPGIRGTGHAILVLAEDYLELRNYLGTDVHGILGYELFSRFVVTLNYTKKTMTVSSPEAFKARSKYQKIPITVEDTKPYLMANVIMTDSTSIPAKLLVDSGASHGLLLESQSDDRIHVPEHTISSYIGRGLGGAITGKVGRIKALQIGHYKLPNAIASFPDPNSYMDSLKLGFTPRNGTIGGEVLSRFTVIFNFSQEEMYLKKNSAFKKKFYYNLSGVIIKAKGANLSTFEVIEVKEKSAAAIADVREGDLILAINGISTHHLTLNLITGILNAKPGKKVRLEINRAGQILKKKLELRSMI